MKLEKLGLLALCSMFVLSACKKDDDGGGTITPPRDRAEQQITDDAALQEYLNSHYYNAVELSNITDASISDIKITALAEGETEAPADHVMLADAVEDHDVVYAEADYVYYILRIRPGGGSESPTFADNVRLLYEGFKADGKVFDSAPNPVTFDLTQLIPGWRKVIPQFNTALFPPQENNDGTVDYIDGGLGVMFLPSGLAYFNNATSGISAYTPIMFKFELLQTFQNDHDNDGIPSYLEDINGDGEFTISSVSGVSDDDTDNDNIPNYADTDDDADRLPTIEELESITYMVDTNVGETEPVLDAEVEFLVSRDDNGGVITIKTLKIVDSNNDDLGDHLDKDIAIRNRTN